MRHVLITGGSKGIGYQVTDHLLQQGYSITVNYRSDEEAINDLRKKWSHALDRLQFIKGDITDREFSIYFVKEAMDRFGRIDCLINNAGPYIFERKPLIEYTDGEWNNMLDGNLTAVFYLLKQVIPIMRKQHFGRIINYGFQDAGSAPGWQYRAAFAAAKVGLVSLTKSVALEEAAHGITSNMVCPGMIVDEMKTATIEEARNSLDKYTPLGRPASGADIARMITFLCDGKSDMVNGSIIEITGAIDVINRFRPKLDE